MMANTHRVAANSKLIICHIERKLMLLDVDHVVLYVEIRCI